MIGINMTNTQHDVAAPTASHLDREVEGTIFYFTPKDYMANSSCRVSPFLQRYEFQGMSGSGSSLLRAPIAPASGARGILTGCQRLDMKISAPAGLVSLGC